MSVKALSAVWEHSEAKGGERLVLLAIADNARDDGSGAWPSLTRLCQKTLFSERNVRYLLRRLEESGELEIQYGAGPRGCNLYELHLPGWHPTREPEGGAKIAPAKIAPRQNSAPEGGQNPSGGGKDFTKGGQRVAPEPSLSRPLDPSVRNRQSARARTVPADFAVSPAVRRWAAERLPGVDVDAEFEQFADFHAAKGSLFKDWDAALRTWLRRTPTFARGPTRAAGRGNGAPADFDPTKYRVLADWHRDKAAGGGRR